MSECLVTKLKGTVSDSSLLTLNELRITYDHNSGGSDNCLLLCSNEDQTVSVVGDGTISATDGGEGVASIALSAGVDTEIYFTGDSSYELSIPNKYALTRIGNSTHRGAENWGYNLADIKYCTSLVCISNGYPGKGDLSDLPAASDVVLLNIQGDNYTGDISSINERIQLPSLSQWIMMLSCPNFTGDLSTFNIKGSAGNNVLSIQNNKKITGDLASCINGAGVAYVNIIGESAAEADWSSISGSIDDITETSLKSLNIYRTNVGGTIEGFVAKQREQGNTSGSLSTTWWGSNRCTFKGATFSFSGTDNPLSWTESQITFNKETIDA